VAVVIDGEGDARAVAGAAREAGAVEALHAAPAVVQAAVARELEVDLFTRALAHVAHPHVPGDAIEAEAPRVANTERPDLIRRGGVPDEGVAGGDVREGDVGATAVAEARVEHAVSAELDAATVVVGEGLRHGAEDRREGRRVRHVGVGTDRVLTDHRGAARVRVGDVELAVRRIVGVEGHPQEAALAATVGERVDVQEGRREEGTVLDDLDPAALLDDEQSRGVTGRRAEEQGRSEAAGDLAHLEVLCRGAGGGDRRGQEGRRADREQLVETHGEWGWSRGLVG
jgi:hypothetical protein